MASKKKGSIITKQELLNQYTSFILEQGKKPSNVYKFCKEIGVEEKDFYKHFASLEMIEAEFFIALHEYTIQLLNSNIAFTEYDNANKLLSYYFTFFEMAAANRSYILISLKSNNNPIESLLQLKGLREHFLDFAGTISNQKTIMSNDKLKKIETRVLQEGAWLQFLFTLKFWINDHSANFEKTDLLIEKSVRASFDILENFPMKSVVDLGKFLWKESPFK